MSSTFPDILQSQYCSLTKCGEPGLGDHSPKPGSPHFSGDFKLNNKRHKFQVARSGE